MLALPPGHPTVRVRESWRYRGPPIAIDSFYVHQHAHGTGAGIRILTPEGESRLAWPPSGLTGLYQQQDSGVSLCERSGPGRSGGRVADAFGCGMLEDGETVELICEFTTEQEREWLYYGMSIGM